MLAKAGPVIAVVITVLPLTRKWCAVFELERYLYWLHSYLSGT